MSDPVPDKKLIQQYLKGDSGALELLIARYLKMIYSFVYKNVGNQADAEDITQEVFVRVWKNIKKFDQKRAFKPWIFQIAKNASIDFLRKKKSIPFSRFENEKGQNVLTENIASKEQDLLKVIGNRKAASFALSTLTSEEQRIITMRHTDGMSFKEIAESFEESINTIKSRYRRIIKHLNNRFTRIDL